MGLVLVPFYPHPGFERKRCRWVNRGIERDVNIAAIHRQAVRPGGGVVRRLDSVARYNSVLRKRNSARGGSGLDIGVWRVGKTNGRPWIDRRQRGRINILPVVPVRATIGR